MSVTKKDLEKKQTLTKTVSAALSTKTKPGVTEQTQESIVANARANEKPNEKAKKSENERSSKAKAEEGKATDAVAETSQIRPALTNEPSAKDDLPLPEPGDIIDTTQLSTSVRVSCN
ncbi:unnamed protein product [Anisakis simplex]|uniref:Uncharacterized protein n=1 Tax=Anisakis simplex TaxID=6269 RepID=A0A0M3J6H8_ANISI|nr:unnamed protein product [Anisakis simplex]